MHDPEAFSDKRQRGRGGVLSIESLDNNGKASVSDTLLQHLERKRRHIELHHSNLKCMPALVRDLCACDLCHGGVGDRDARAEM